MLTKTSQDRESESRFGATPGEGLTARPLHVQHTITPSAQSESIRLVIIVLKLIVLPHLIYSLANSL